MTITHRSRPATPARPSDVDGAHPPARPARIGVAVVASVAAGLLTALAVVVGPAAGAPEPVITGGVLLSFAAGWALLALLSRCTDQPQRWAVVPAALMAATGCGLLSVDSIGDASGWVWAPAAAALAAWIVVRARRDLRSHTRTFVIHPVCAVLALSAVGGLYETASEATARTADVAPGRLVDVGGHRLWLHCTGAGQPTVVLEPGLGAPSADMAWVAPRVAATTRVCVYDRAGRGRSESAAAPQDGTAVATDLHTLLTRAGETGPYVLVGHSAGGIYALNFARLHPDETAGVVLLDSMHPDQYDRIASWPAFYETFRRASAFLPTLARLGTGRIVANVQPAALPQPERDRHRDSWSTPRHFRSLRDEFSELRTAMRQAGGLASLGDRPLVVVTAGRDAQPGWAEAQDDLATLSSDVDHRRLPDATHDMLVGDERTATVSADAVVDVVTAVRVGSCLTGTCGASPQTASAS